MDVLIGTSIDKGIRLIEQRNTDRALPKSLEDSLSCLKRIQNCRKALCLGAAGVAAMCVVGARYWPYEFIIYKGIEIRYHIRLAWFALPLSPILLGISSCMGRCASRRFALISVWHAQQDGFGGEIWEHFKSLAHTCRELDMKGEAFGANWTDRDVQTLAQAAPNLKKLGISSSRLTSEAFTHLVDSCRSLATLRLYDSCSIGEECFEELERLEELQELFVEAAPDWCELKTLGKLIKLQRLTIGSSRIGEGSATQILKLLNLRYFSLTSPDLNCTEFGRMRELSCLHTFILDTGQIDSSVQASAAEDTMNRGLALWTRSTAQNKHIFSLVKRDKYASNDSSSSHVYVGSSSYHSYGGGGGSYSSSSSSSGGWSFSVTKVN